MERMIKVVSCVLSLMVSWACIGALADDNNGRKLNVLCVCAHPDDAELLCGGTLLKYHKQGHNIFIVLTTSGNTGSNTIRNVKEIGRIREAEMLASAKIYDAKVRFLRADDERLFDTNEMRTKVLDAMRWADPDVIFTHAPTDESPDHWTTAKIVCAMVISLPGINQQSVERPCTKRVSVFTCGAGLEIGFVPDVYVDISDELESVCEAINLHASQKIYMMNFKGSEDISLNKRKIAAFRGMQYGCQYAEGFCAWRVAGYLPDFKILP
ncbi:MAG: PIG-L family deacetylase [Kiritimatiellae bacterium]|nr:PIG-L family deacetylase [Kiritimatiellia bacterium]